jgi:hypothetical protein
MTDIEGEGRVPTDENSTDEKKNDIFVSQESDPSENVALDEVEVARGFGSCLRFPSLYPRLIVELLHVLLVLEPPSHLRTFINQVILTPDLDSCFKRL